MTRQPEPAEIPRKSGLNPRSAGRLDIFGGGGKLKSVFRFAGSFDGKQAGTDVHQSSEVSGFATGHSAATGTGSHPLEEVVVEGGRGATGCGAGRLA